MSKLERFSTVSLTLCALAFTAVVVRREYSRTSGPVSRGELAKPVAVREWSEILRAAHRTSTIDTPVVIAEFLDIECPFCRKFHESAVAVARRHPGAVSFAFVHYPLPQHRLAVPGARALECAGAQQRFEQMLSELFSHQGVLDSSQWLMYAKQAGISDTAAFASCVQGTTPIRGVVEGRTLGEAIDVRGTPTVIVNGWRYPQAPSEVELEQIIARALAKPVHSVQDQSRN